MEKMRTHTCGGLSKQDLGQRVRLCGWADTVRDHGGVVFIDLRDRYGITQVIFDPTEAHAAWLKAQGVRSEFVLQIEGTVRPRPADMVNSKLPTGAIEVYGDNVEILNTSDTPPFPLDDEKASKVAEDLRFTYRYLDLRRPRMQRNLKLRHEISLVSRNYLAEHKFLEIETPLLTKSTPEGSRDYIVPSRTVPGKFFALPQSPQQYKQLLMVGGCDRYYQIARCCRDEDLRADRQPEFTQIDLEMSFVTCEEIYELIDGLLARIMAAAGHGKIMLPLPRLSYQEAMDRFGSDKPDLRFGLELVDVSNVFAKTGFKVFANVLGKGGVIKAINARGLADVSLKTMEDWEKVAKEEGLGGLAHIRVQRDGSWKSPILKFFSDEEKAALEQALAIESGDLIMFAADKPGLANKALGRLRLIAAQTANIIPADVFAFTWVTDFPLFERSKEGRLQAAHHPFTRPHPEDIPLLDTDPLKVRALAYDIVLNGVELGGGSLRIHESHLQEKIFQLLKLSPESIQDRFGHLIKAFAFGAPPHGGLALGLDRVLMLMAKEDSIREVIAFPKTQKAVDLMMNAPDVVDDEQLRDVYLSLALPKDQGNS